MGTPTSICTAAGPRALAGLLASEVPEPPNANIFSSIEREPQWLQHDRKQHQQELSPAAVKIASPDRVGGGSFANWIHRKRLKRENVGHQWQAERMECMSHKVRSVGARALLGLSTNLVPF